MQQSNKKKEQCTTMGAQWPFLKAYSSKKKVVAFKAKYKADLKRRWHQEVELELIERENSEPSDAQ